MDQQTLLAMFDNDLRIGIEYPGMRKDVLPGLVRFVRPAPGMSFITYANPPADQLDATIEQQIAYFEEAKLPLSWKVYTHDPQNELVDRLQAHGFSATEPEPVMLLDLAAAAELLRAPVPANVRRITEPAGLDDVVAVESQVWGGDFAWLGSTTSRAGSSPACSVAQRWRRIAGAACTLPCWPPARKRPWRTATAT